MGTVSNLTFEEYIKRQEAADETIRYELDEGKLLSVSSPTLYNNIVRYRLQRALADFVETKRLGLVIDEIDFRLAANTVRKSNIAFVTTNHLQRIDIHRSPIEGGPALA